MVVNASGGMHRLTNSLSSCNDTNDTSLLPIELYHKTIHISLVVFCSIYMLLVILAIIYQVIVIVLQSCQINFKYLYTTVSVFIMHQNTQVLLYMKSDEIETLLFCVFSTGHLHQCFSNECFHFREHCIFLCCIMAVGDISGSK